MSLRFAIAIVLVLFFRSLSFSQRCKVISDPITGENSLQFKTKNGALGFDYKGGDSIQFNMSLSYSGQHETNLQQGSLAHFKLNNDKILTLISVNESKPITMISESSVSTEYHFEFMLDKPQIDALANSRVVLLRFPAPQGGTKDFKLKGLLKIWSGKLYNGAQCISSNL